MLIKENITDWNHKSIVFVPGLGRPAAEFAAPLQDLLRKADPDTADGCLWHAAGVDGLDAALQDKVNASNQALEKDGGNPLVTLGADFVVDLANTLSAVDTAAWIEKVRATLVDVVEEGRKRNVEPSEHEVYLVTHGLGSVIAYETLHAIVTGAHLLGRTGGFRVQTLFTLGSPLAFIKEHEKRVTGVTDDFFLKDGEIARPAVTNKVTGKPMSNVNEWVNLRHKIDPVASLSPLTIGASNGAVTDDRVFDKLHAGPNPHDAANYLTEFAPFFWETVRG